MKIKIIAFLFLVVFTSCAGSAPQKEMIAQNANRAANAAPGRNAGAGEENPTQPNVTIDQADKSKSETVPVSRKIIRNADLNLEADSPEETQQKITAIAESKGGFVVESQQTKSSSEVTKRDIVTMTVRVPAAKFSESLDEIRKTASRVIAVNVKGQDVTEEFVDIEARLKAKKALEAQFIEIMKQGKTVADALQVQRELANVRGEIEQIEGRMRFLENQTSLSTITLKLQTPATYSPNSSGFFYQLVEAFSNGFSFALNFILGFVTLATAILPFFILVVLPLYLIIRYFWRKNNKVNVAKDIVEDEIKTE